MMAIQGEQQLELVHVPVLEALVLPDCEQVVRVADKRHLDTDEGIPSAPGRFISSGLPIMTS